MQAVTITLSSFASGSLEFIYQAQKNQLKFDDVFDENGNYLRSQKGSGFVLITKGKELVTFSKAFKGGRKDLKMVANVSLYYLNIIHKKAGLRVRAANKRNKDVPAFFMPQDKLSGKPTIGINVFENTLNKHFDKINSFKSILRHEVIHFYNYEKNIDDDFGLEHAEVYVNQMREEEFINSPMEFKENIANGMIKEHLIPVATRPVAYAEDDAFAFLKKYQSVFKSAGLEIKMTIQQGNGKLDKFYINGKPIK